jgi:uncharacterized protein YerC
MTSKEARQKVAGFIKNNPHLTYKQISEKLDCGLSTIGRVAREFQISRQKHKPLCEADLSKLEAD